MNTTRNMKISTYINCIGISYCEVPIEDARCLELPIVYGDRYRGYSTNAVNILGDFYTSVWLQPNVPQYVIQADDSNKNTYNACESCYSYFTLNRNKIAIAVPRTCGCIVSACGKASSKMYAIFVINRTQVEVLRVDRLPLHVLVSSADELIKCPAVWLLHMLKDTCTEILNKHSVEEFRAVFEQRCADGVLFRMCNAKFLSQLSLEDFRIEVQRHSLAYCQDT